MNQVNCQVSDVSATADSTIRNLHGRPDGVGSVDERTLDRPPYLEWTVWCSFVLFRTSRENLLVLNTKKLLMTLSPWDLPPRVWGSQWCIKEVPGGRGWGHEFWRCGGGVPPALTWSHRRNHQPPFPTPTCGAAGGNRRDRHGRHKVYLCHWWIINYLLFKNNTFGVLLTETWGPLLKLSVPLQEPTWWKLLCSH